jgi:hypothetical protein
MRPALLGVSAQPAGWSACRSTGRRLPVVAWAIFAEDGRLATVGLVARGGSSLVRGDRLAGFTGYAPGPGCEPQLEPPALAPADLDSAMAAALSVDADEWSEYEAHIRANLTSAAATEWATASLAGFDEDPKRWFRLWLRGRREHEATEHDLLQRLRALSLVAPGRSLEQALGDCHITLGALLSAEPPGDSDQNVRSELARKPGREGEIS